MSVKEILKENFKNLLLELKKLRGILISESEELAKGKIRVLDITNHKKDLLLESIKNYYVTINHWLKYKSQKLEDFSQFVQEINLLKVEICTRYQTSRKILLKILDTKRKVPKIKYLNRILTDQSNIPIPIMINIKI